MEKQLATKLIWHNEYGYVLFETTDPEEVKVGMLAVIEAISELRAQKRKDANVQQNKTPKSKSKESKRR